MSTTTNDMTTCVLCGYGEGYGALNDFERHRGFDFCAWCADDDSPTLRLTCGSHTVTFAESGASWVCTCGSTYGTVVLSLRLNGVPLAALDAAPDLSRATASLHVLP